MAGTGAGLRRFAAVLAIVLALPASAGSLERGAAYLRARQSRDGSWTALILASSARYNLYTVFLYEYLGLIEAKRSKVDALMDYAWAQQGATGGVPGYSGGADDLDLSLQTYLAARMAGEAESTPRMRALRAAIERMGGIKSAGLTARPYLWLFDLDATGSCLPAAALPKLLGLDDKLPWVRVMAYPFGYMLGYGKTHPLPREKYPFELHPSARGVCRSLPVLHRMNRGGRKEFVDWVRTHLNSDGTMFDYSPTTVPTLMALSTLGPRYRASVAKGLRAIEGFQAMTSAGLYQAPGEASIAETYLAVWTLLDLGYPPDDPAVAAGEGFLLSRMQPGTGAFGFSKHNEHFPDTDDTANAIGVLYQLARLKGVSHPERPFLKGMDWLVAQQNGDGGFGTWEKDRLPMFQGLFERIAGKDGLVFAESVVEHTARVAITLAEFRRFDSKYDESYRRALRWLVSRQAADGGYSGTWFVDRLFGTAMVAAALGTAAGDAEADRSARRAIEFVLRHQAADGGFSESPRSFEVGDVVPLAESSPAQTGLIVSQLLWLVELGHDRSWPRLSTPLGRAVEFLERTQASDGGWHDGTWTGVTFPKIEYLVYPHVQDIEALHALARFRAARTRN